MGDAWKSSIRSGDASPKRGTLFIGNADSHYVILLYCETLLQFLLGIYCKRFYQIPIFTILLLFYVFEVGKTKSSTHRFLMILTLKSHSRKIFRFFYFNLEISDKTMLHPKLCWLHPSEILRPKIESPGNYNFFLTTPRKFHIVFG